MPYIVAELLEGEELRAQLSDGALPVRKVLDYARQIADGLAAAQAGRPPRHEPAEPDAAA